MTSLDVASRVAKLNPRTVTEVTPRKKVLAAAGTAKQGMATHVTIPCPMEAAGIEPCDDIDATDDDVRLYGNRTECRAANVLQAGVADGQSLASADAAWQFDSSETPSAAMRVVACWSRLPPHIREAILTLVDAGSVGLASD